RRIRLCSRGAGSVRGLRLPYPRRLWVPLRDASSAGAIKVVSPPPRQPAGPVHGSFPVIADTSPSTRCGGIAYTEAATAPRATVVPPDSITWPRTASRDSMQWPALCSAYAHACTPTDADASTAPVGRAVPPTESRSLEIGRLPASATTRERPDDHSFACAVRGLGFSLDHPPSTQPLTLPLTRETTAWNL